MVELLLLQTSLIVDAIENGLTGLLIPSRNSVVLADAL